MQLISKYNKRLRFLLCVTNNFSKDAWVVPLKDKKGIAINNAFQKAYYIYNIYKSIFDIKCNIKTMSKSICFVLSILYIVQNT